MLVNLEVVLYTSESKSYIFAYRLVVFEVVISWESRLFAYFYEDVISLII